MTTIQARDHAERVAVFRHGIIGALATRDAMSHGELAEALRRIAEECQRPPDADRTRTFSVATLERWLYAYKKGGLEALRPGRRSDRGHGRDLDPALRELLLDIRREFPSASVPLILRTLVVEGRVDAGFSAADSASRFCTRSRTTRPRAARWSASGSRCAGRCSTTAPGSRRCTRSRCVCSRGSTRTTTRRRTQA